MIAFSDDPRATRTPGLVVLSRTCSFLGLSAVVIGVALLVVALVHFTVALAFAGIAAVVAGLAIHAVGVGFGFRSGVPIGFRRYRN